MMLQVSAYFNYLLHFYGPLVIFLLYDILSGWSTKGKLACPVCNEETSSLHLKNGHKTCYMAYRHFLPKDHKWRANRSSFDGTKEHQLPPKA